MMDHASLTGHFTVVNHVFHGDQPGIECFFNTASTPNEFTNRLTQEPSISPCHHRIAVADTQQGVVGSTIYYSNRRVKLLIIIKLLIGDLISNRYSNSLSNGDLISNRWTYMCQLMDYTAWGQLLRPPIALRWYVGSNRYPVQSEHIRTHHEAYKKPRITPGRLHPASYVWVWPEILVSLNVCRNGCWYINDLPCPVSFWWQHSSWHATVQAMMNSIFQLFLTCERPWKRSLTIINHD